jgi:hypothetical protein
MSSPSSYSQEREIRTVPLFSLVFSAGFSWGLTVLPPHYVAVGGWALVVSTGDTMGKQEHKVTRADDLDRLQLTIDSSPRRADRFFAKRA